MRSVFAILACCGAVVVAFPKPAFAQAPVAQIGRDAPKVVAVDPATAQGLTSAGDDRPPPDIDVRAADFISENVRLKGQWFYAAENQGRKLPTVIIAPGWGGTAVMLHKDALDLARAGFLVMLFDYRGWGDSEGRVMLTGQKPGAGGDFTAQVRELRGYVDPSEQVEDWFNAISYAVTDPMVDAGRIGILGSDLAGGHVIAVAAHEPRIKALVSQVSSVDTRPYKPYQLDPANVIAQANAAASRIATGQEPYPAERARIDGAPLGAKVGAAVGAKVVRWAPVEEAIQVTTPALFVLAQKEELFANANNGQLACERVMGPRKLVMIPDITHYGIYDVERKRAMMVTIDWFDRFLKPAGAPTRVPVNPKEPERGPCNPPPVPPKGEEDANGSGEGHRAQDASGRFN